MRKAVRWFFALSFAVIALSPGHAIAGQQGMSGGEASAEERVEATEAALGSLEADEAALKALPEGPQGLDEEVKDEALIDSDA